MVGEEEPRVVGKAVSYRLDDGELLVAVELSAPVDAEEIDQGAWLGDFRTGVPLGTKIEARFEGRREAGLIEVSVFDRDVAWAPGVFEANAPDLIGKELTIRPRSSRH